MKSLFMILAMLWLFGTTPATANSTLPNKLTTTTSTTLANGNQFFVSSGTQKLSAAFEIMPDGSISMSTFPSVGPDADGIFFDRSSDMLYQLNRSANKINGYSGVNTALMNSQNPTLSLFSSSNFNNGREIAISDGRLVVAQDEVSGTNPNAFVIYNIGTSSITYEKTFASTINLWGIQIEGNTMYAIEDNSNRLAIYDNFLDGVDGSTATPSNMVTIDGIVRTHGLTYHTASDLMILTDVGSGAVADDGAVVVVENWSTASADGTVMMSEQLRIAGSLSRLGNPVDVAYAPDENMIFVAERANTNGLVLGFNFPTASGDLKPKFKQKFKGAASIHFSDTDVEDCDFVRGGHVTFVGGGTERTTYSDGAADMLSFESNIDAAVAGHSFTYVVTDANGSILGIPPGNMVDFDPAGLGVCRVYGLSYTGNLNIMQGSNFLDPNLAISDGCFDVSDNYLSVNRISPPNQFFVSSNTSKQIGVIGVLNGEVVETSTFPVIAPDADGVYYDAGVDALYQANRTANKVNAYSNVSINLASGNNPDLSAISTSNFSNAREIAVYNGKLVVAQDAANGNPDRFVIYNASPSSITYEKTFESSIALWGIHLEGNTMYAIKDVSDQLEVYDNFFDGADGSTPVASLVVTIDGIVRTHGITYYSATDLMILTDVGSGAVDNDGALVVVENWTTASADGTITMAEQVRIAGPMSLLGNPVDVAYDEESTMIFVAERANAGGRILGFDFPTSSGDAAPSYNELFAGASAINTTNGPVDACDFVQGGHVTFTGGGTERTTYFDGGADVLSFETNIDSMAYGHSFTYVVTDANGSILGIPPGNMVDFDPAGVGVCRVYGVSYTGNLNITTGMNFLDPNLAISDNCFDVSDNYLSVNRLSAPQNFFVSSNTQKNVGVFGLLGGEVVQMSTFKTIASDADGIFYDQSADVIYQLNRTASKINAYSDVNVNIVNGNNPSLSAISPSGFTNGREIAVSNGKLVAAQDAASSNGNLNRFIIYDATPNAITYEKIYESTINLWGIHAEGTTLFAIEDNSDRLAIYNDFFSGTDGSTATPDMMVTIDGIVRTHGITYDVATDLMILTDVGSGAIDDDGAIVVVENWTTASADGTVTMAEQVRIAGPMSLLGNPVDVAYDENSFMIFVAERANGGGRVLGFDYPSASGDAAPMYNELFSGASAIHLPNPNSGNGGGSVVNATATDVDVIETKVQQTVTMDKLFPNPAVDQINVSIESTIDQEATIMIYDARGAMIESRKIELIKGQNLNSFDINNLTPGYYFLAIPATGTTTPFVKSVK